jgi:hypothetical protein
MLNAIKPPHKSLSELEHQIMEILWAHGPATSDQVRSAPAAKRPRSKIRRCERFFGARAKGLRSA